MKKILFILLFVPVAFLPAKVHSQIYDPNVNLRLSRDLLDSLRLLEQSIKERVTHISGGGGTTGGALETSQRTIIWQKHNTDSLYYAGIKTDLDSLLYKQNQVTGLRGHYPAVITTATTYIPLGRIVEVLEAAVIASLSYTDQADSLVTITAGAGQRFYGRFKHIKLTSGKVIVYK